MSKQMIDIEVPEGWVAVDYRNPQIGEHYLSDGGLTVSYCHFELGAGLRYVIVELKPEYREYRFGLQDGWIAADSSGGAFWFSEKPWVDDGVWRFTGLSVFLGSAIVFEVDGDWRDSLRRVKGSVRSYRFA